MTSIRRALTQFTAPDEVGAQDRAWGVVRAAYLQRLAPDRSRSYRRPASAVLVGVLLAGAVALSPAGATVGRLIGRALGVQHASRALFSLPGTGRVLVSGAGGTWTVGTDGASRRVGRWTQASWSPHGRYLAVADREGLSAVNAHGVAQWALARADVADPRWYSPSGYRVAYLSGGELRVVAGDGTGDHLLAAKVAPIAPAWRPGHPYELAYLTAGRAIVVRDADSGAVVWVARPGMAVRQLAWSTDGEQLLVVSAGRVMLYSAGGRLILDQLEAAGIIDGALSPDGHALALVTGGANGAVLVENVVDRASARRVLAGSGLDQVAWSPDGRWLLISWPAANQWVFVRVAGVPRISAVSRISQQFSRGVVPTFPRVDGWCCSAG